MEDFSAGSFVADLLSDEAWLFGFVPRWKKKQLNCTYGQEEGKRKSYLIVVFGEPCLRGQGLVEFRVEVEGVLEEFQCSFWFIRFESVNKKYRKRVTLFSNKTTRR